MPFYSNYQLHRRRIGKQENYRYDHAREKDIFRFAWHRRGRSLSATQTIRPNTRSDILYLPEATRPLRGRAGAFLTVMQVMASVRAPDNGVSTRGQGHRMSAVKDDTALINRKSEITVSNPVQGSLLPTVSSVNAEPVQSAKTHHSIKSQRKTQMLKNTERKVLSAKELVDLFFDSASLGDSTSSDYAKKMIEDNLPKQAQRMADNGLCAESLAALNRSVYEYGNTKQHTDIAKVLEHPNCRLEHTKQEVIEELLQGVKSGDERAKRHLDQQPQGIYCSEEALESMRITGRYPVNARQPYIAEHIIDVDGSSIPVFVGETPEPPKIAPLINGNALNWEDNKHLAVVNGYCTASIVSNRQVITAAHCILEGGPKGNHIKYGAISRTLLASDIKFHYNVVRIDTPNISFGPSNINDIAMITVDRDFESACALSLPGEEADRVLSRALADSVELVEEVSTNPNLRVQGNGAISAHASAWTGLRTLSDKFEEIYPVTQTKEWCQNRHPTSTPSSFFCYHPPNTKIKIGACAGDSGGPIFMYDPVSRKEAFVGISIKAYNYCQSNLGLKINSHRDFLMRHLLKSSLPTCTPFKNTSQYMRLFHPDSQSLPQAVKINIYNFRDTMMRVIFEFDVKKERHRYTRYFSNMSQEPKSFIFPATSRNIIFKITSMPPSFLGYQDHLISFQAKTDYLIKHKSASLYVWGAHQRSMSLQYI